jgi:hypothetical protein
VFGLAVGLALEFGLEHREVVRDDELDFVARPVGGLRGHQTRAAVYSSRSNTLVDPVRFAINKAYTHIGSIDRDLNRSHTMAKLKDVTKSVATRAKAGQKAVKAAVKTASKAVSKAKADTSRAVTKARAGASKLAAKAAVKLAPTPSRKKKVARALVAAGAVVGAAAVAAASVSAARARKQR